MAYLQQLKKKLSAEITEIPEAVQGRYFPALDGLRAVAVMMVILYHFGVNHFLRPYQILINGDLGVNIFFVISGFLITTLLLKEKLKYGQISLKRFYIRRALRILPAAYLFLFVLIILAAIYKFRISVPDFIASFLFYKNLPYQNETFTGHFWSLAAEVQFYLIFPFLLALNIKRYLWIILSIVIIVPLISVLGYYCPGFLNGNPVSHSITQITMYVFWKGPFIILIGSLCAVLLFKGIIKIDNKKSQYLFSFILLITAITISSTSFLFYTKYVSEYLSAILVAWALVINLGRHNFLSALLSSRIFVRMGVISYSLYLWQQPFVGAHTWQPWMKPFYGCSLGILICVKLVIVFLVAFCSWYFVEMKFLKLKKRYEL